MIPEIKNTINNKHLVLDLSHIEFIDSNGLGLIVKEGQKIRNVNQNMYILNPSKQVMKILRETNMHKYYPIIGTVDQVG